MSETDWERLDRYLSGEASPEECERVEAWLAEDPDRWAHVIALREAIARGALSEPAVEEAKAEVWARLQRGIGAAEAPRGKALAQSTGGRGRKFAFAFGGPLFRNTRLAAALFIAVLGGTTVGALILRWGSPGPTGVLHVANTGPGQRAVFHLADGTRVLLGATSRLRYPADFTGRFREVSLEGEAYFQVVHDQHRPFVVRAADLVARDLGTEFTVRAYPEDAGAWVVVREGRVAIRALVSGSGATERVVAAGQLGRLGGGGEPTVEPADTAAWFAWTEGRLVFANTPLREAIRQIERSRNVEIRLLPPELGERRFTTSFGDEPTTVILDVIGTGLRLDVEQTGPRNYTVRAK